MSQEILEIVKGLDLHKVETQIALQCAPLITGIKISNLLIVSRHSVSIVLDLLKSSGISYYCLLDGEDKSTLLLYKKDQLSSYLEEDKVKRLLIQFGYNTKNLKKMLELFQKRYQGYMSGNKDFPHELGLFLGYPVEDVEGFIINEGKNFLYTGYWKVYENPTEKISLFQKYEKAKATLLQLISNGISMHGVLDLYKSAV